MSRKRKRRKAGILEKSLHAIISKIKINHSYDVPYIAGYSKSGKTIYIDKRLPLYLPQKGKHRIRIDKFLALHEIVEKALIKELGHIHYEYAHEIARLAEQTAVRRSKISVKKYDRFIARYSERIEHEKVLNPPPDLDLKPYRDEKDYDLISHLQRLQKRKKNERNT